MSEFRLSEEQQKIVEATGNIVVVAGAGTGKTETLTQRVLHTLTAHREYSLRELIVLTFTDKAAAEMRQRIYRGLLARLITETDETERARWRMLCASFAQSHRIETFDAFNHRLLLAYPEYQLAPNSFTPMSDFDTRKLLGKLSRAFWAWLESIENDAPERADFMGLLEDFNRHQILHLLELLAAETASEREKLAVLPDAENYRQELRALVSRFTELLSRRENRRLDRLWREYETARDTKFPGLPPAISEALRDPEQLRPRDSQVLTTTGSFRKKWIPDDCKDDCAEIEEKVFPVLKPWQKAEAELALSLETFADPEQTWESDWRVREQLVRAARLANWWAQKREEICRREGWLDFQAAQRAALSLVEDNPEIAERLRAGCRFVLVDEFQDTNFEQWRMVQAFSSPDNVMLIGDGKQSIYGFRGGDITVFDEVRRDALQIETPHGLSLSQRATPELTQFFNEVFENVLPDESDPERQAWEAPFQKLHSARAEKSSDAVFVLEATQKAENIQNSEALENGTAPPQPFLFKEPREVEHLAEATALFLRELQDDADSGEHLSSENSALIHPQFSSISKLLREKQAATIGVLFSTHAVKATYETKLREHGVRYASVKGIGFYGTQPVSDAINWLRFFFDARDDLALSGVLRSPFLGTSDVALLEIKRFALESGAASFWDALQNRDAANVTEEFRLEDDEERVLARAKSSLLRWRETAQIEPLSVALENIERETEIAFARALSEDAAQETENWRKVTEIIREREASGQGSARALAEYFSDQAQSEEREADAELPEGGAVQLMTIHAAKGLGFHMTIVAQMDGNFRFGEDLLRRGEIEKRDEKHFALNIKDDEGNEQKNLIWEILKENNRAKSEAEWARLFYVACTRTRDFLILAMPQNVKPGTWAKMAEAFVEGKPRLVLNALQERADARSKRNAGTENVRAQSILPPDVDAALLQPLPKNAFGLEASVTQTVRPQVGSTPKARDGLGRKEREYGTLFHRLLRARVEANDDARIASFLATTNLSSEDATSLSSALQAAYAWLNEQKFDLSRAQHEVDFSVPTAALSGVLPKQNQASQWTNGAIDLLVPHGDEWAIIDFKISKEKLSLESETPPEYEDQLRLYRAVTELSGKRISKCWLLFLDGFGGVSARCVERKLP